MGAGADEDKTMNTPPVYWGRINGWSVLASIGGISVACVGGIIAGSLWFGETNNKLANVVTKPELMQALQPINTKLDASERASKSSDESIEEIRTIIAPVASTALRVTQLEADTNKLAATMQAQDKATNERIDRVVESIAGKLDKAVSALNELNVTVKVQGSQLEDLRSRLGAEPNPQKLIWRSGVPRPDRPIVIPEPTRKPE